MQRGLAVCLGNRLLHRAGMLWRHCAPVLKGLLLQLYISPLIVGSLVYLSEDDDVTIHKYIQMTVCA